MLENRFRNAAGKKGYRKPQVRLERVFETMALTCGKHISTQCPTGVKLS